MYTEFRFAPYFCSKCIFLLLLRITRYYVFIRILDKNTKTILPVFRNISRSENVKKLKFEEAWAELRPKIGLLTLSENFLLAL